MKKIIVSLLILFRIMPIGCYAKISHQVIKREFIYTSLPEDAVSKVSTFTYSDVYFTNSSYIGNKDLEILSIQVASSSISKYEDDEYEVNNADDAENIIDFLEKMHFNDIEINEHYKKEKKANSVGVIIGSKEIVVGEDTYTLLVILPRSAGYKEEWVGNFTIGDTGIHDGFKMARDEMLRFTKKYITDHNIEGKLKVWISGYSRGAAIANSLAGFFAGGGIEYFNNVSITPEDVYCYSIGTPRVIVDGTSKNIFLSVGASIYDDDTKGDAYTYTKGGVINPSDTIYNGIRSIISTDDIFPLLPFSKWGYTHFGEVITPTYNEDDMVNYLKSINPYTYNVYNNSKKFMLKTFDFKTLSIVDYKDSNSGDFMKERFDALISKVPNDDVYKSEYESSLQSAIGLYGMSEALLSSKDISLNTSDAITTILYTYLSYVDSEYIDLGKASNEGDATTLTLIELLSYATGENIDSDITFDEFMAKLAKFISDNDKVADSIINLITSSIPETYLPYLSIFQAFIPEGIDNTNENGIKSLLKACYYGVDETSPAYSSYTEASQVRQLIYGLATMFIGDYPEIKAIMLDSNNNFIIDTKLKDYVNVILDLVLTEKDDDGNVIKKYNNIGEMADSKLVNLLDNIYSELLPEFKRIYGDEYHDTIVNHLNIVKTNIDKVRIVISILLFGSDNFTIENSIINVATIVENSTNLVMPHFDELYLAKIMAYDHFNDYQFITGDGETFKGKISFKTNFNYDDFTDNGVVYIDGEVVDKSDYTLSKGSTIITFNNDYAKKLSLGEHNIVASMNGINIQATFKTASNNNPDTGDNIIIYIVMLTISMIGFLTYKKAYYETI